MHVRRRRKPTVSNRQQAQICPTHHNAITYADALWHSGGRAILPCRLVCRLCEHRAADVKLRHRSGGEIANGLHRRYAMTHLVPAVHCRCRQEVCQRPRLAAHFFIERRDPFLIEQEPFPLRMPLQPVRCRLPRVRQGRRSRRTADNSGRLSAEVWRRRHTSGIDGSQRECSAENPSFSQDLYHIRDSPFPPNIHCRLYLIYLSGSTMPPMNMRCHGK